MTELLLATLGSGFLVALLGGWVMRRWAAALGLIDEPGERKVHSHPVPLGGGVAIWCGVLLPLAIGVTLVQCGIDLGPLARQHAEGIRQQTSDLAFLLGCGTLLMLLGLADDRWGLPWQPKMLVQIGVALAVVWGKGWKPTLFVDWPALTDLLGVLWIVGLVNAFNLLDNMDGLSAGVAAIGATLLAAVVLVAPDPQTLGPQLFIAGLLLVLVGALSGFLWHNRPPARLFMGDAGSYFVGFLLAVTTLLATFSGGNLPRHAVLAPLCILAVPIYDTLTVVLIRLRAGRSPFVGDKNHFSHRLVELGLTKPQAVLTIYLTSAACGLPALVLHQVGAAGAVVVGLAVVCQLAVIAILEATSRRHRRK